MVYGDDQGIVWTLLLADIDESSAPEVVGWTSIL